MNTFGLAEDDNYYIVSNGANLVFKVRKTDNGSHSQSIGDLASLKYNEVEYLDKTRGTQINSGFDHLYTDINAVDINAESVDDKYIKVTIIAGDLTHYYICRKNDDVIYMGTIIESEPQTQALVRFIVRSLVSQLPNGPQQSDLRNNIGAIESGDIFGLENGETRSKHYSNMRVCDWNHIGATGDNVGLWIVRGNTEGMSGGPFYRCLLNQCGSKNQEITFIINYGMTQTEDYRFGILNSYALVLTDGSEPEIQDTSWYSELDLKGWTPSDDRGAVSGTVTSILNDNYAYRVVFSNSKAQYWAEVNLVDNSFLCKDILPGIYTVKLYKNELSILSSSVTVAALQTTSLDLTGDINDPSNDDVLWRIGDWDGTPSGLLNSDKVTDMHPSDIRMALWNPGVFTVGQSSAETDFPAYQWQDVNNSLKIIFTLAQEDISDYTLRVGITVAYAGARPSVIVNEWKGTKSATTQPDGRSLTVGSYRGNNATFDFLIPASALLVGENSLTINVSSGSDGNGWLSPGYSFDALDMMKSS